MRKALVGASVLAGLVLFTTTGSALADTSVTPWQKGQIFKEGAASATWVNVPDSPSDTNKRAFQVVIPADGANGCENVTGPNYCYAGFYSKASIGQVLPVARQKNLSFEFSASNPTNASSRISVQFNNGDVAYLDPVTCTHDIAVSGGAWKRADFTGFKSDCSFTVSGDTAGLYAADGTKSAWQVYAETHPDQSVVQRYLVVDASAAGGIYRFDRISLGVGKMYTTSPTVAMSCTSESSC
jgi:hypothetical protein